MAVPVSEKTTKASKGKKSPKASPSPSSSSTPFSMLAASDKRPARAKRVRKMKNGGNFETETNYSLALLRVKVYRGLGRAITAGELRNRYWRDVSNE